MSWMMDGDAAMRTAIGIAALGYAWLTGYHLGNRERRMALYAGLWTLSLVVFLVVTR